jgi:hypothetical protein
VLPPLADPDPELEPEHAATARHSVMPIAAAPRRTR